MRNKPTTAPSDQKKRNARSRPYLCNTDGTEMTASQFISAFEVS